MLIDTDVLIWYMRGNEKAFDTVRSSGIFSISAVTFMELAQGMRNKREMAVLRKALTSWNTEIIQISEEISAKAMQYVEQHCLSHAMQLADALIGATAAVRSIPLLTGNEKHYRVIKEIEIRKFIP
jgi:predicted nucleic acid-binding protein